MPLFNTPMIDIIIRKHGAIYATVTIAYVCPDQGNINRYWYDCCKPGKGGSHTSGMMKHDTTKGDEELIREVIKNI